MVLQHARRLVGWSWIAALAVVVTLWLWLFLLIVWLADGADRIEGQYVPFISDIGARYQTVFIVGTALLLPVVVAQVAVMLWLQWKRARQKKLEWTKYDAVMSALIMTATIVTAVVLVLVAVYDNMDHSDTHGTLAYIFFLAFFVGMVLIMMHLWAWRRHAARLGEGRMERYYRIGAAIATFYVLVILVLGIGAIVVLNTCDEVEPEEETCNAAFTVGSVLEWLIALGYIAFLGSLFLVMRPAPRGPPERDAALSPQHGAFVVPHAVRAVAGVPSTSDPRLERPTAGNASDEGADIETGRPVGAMVG